MGCGGTILIPRSPHGEFINHVKEYNYNKSNDLKSLEEESKPQPEKLRRYTDPSPYIGRKNAQQEGKQMNAILQEALTAGSGLLGRCGEFQFQQRSRCLMGGYKACPSPDVHTHLSGEQKTHIHVK
jgi:hypothetical protein